MAVSPFKKVEVINGPFDPGGQPENSYWPAARAGILRLEYQGRHDRV